PVAACGYRHPPPPETGRSAHRARARAAVHEADAQAARCSLHLTCGSTIEGRPDMAELRTEEDMSDRDAVVALRDVHVHRHTSGQVILSEIDWTVRAGEHWALLGANGAGKTTLLRLLG